MRIALRPTITTDSDVVSLGQLAQLDGGTAVQRHAMSQLDLAVGNAAISRDEALARLLIAGFKAEDFQLTGSPEVNVHAGHLALSNEHIVAAITRHVSGSLNTPEDDIVVELLSGVQLPADLPAVDPVNIRLEPLDHGDDLIGRKTVVLGVFEGNRLVTRMRVNARTSVFREVLVTSRPIERNEVLSNANTYLQRRLFDNNAQGQWTGSDIRGRVSTRRLQAQQTVRPADVQTAAAASPVLVRPRDQVTAIAVKGSLRITMSGMEVMRAGKAGDMVPLRNPRSRKVVYGRVLDSARVELEF
ncbi:MAG: flagellar basal body P-ring formation chaperone FlgA [Pirellulaceae bacterium]